MRFRDTNPVAHQLQLSLYRGMTPERKGEIAALLSDDLRQVARAGVQLRYPGYTDTEVSQALVTLLFGKDVADGIWP